MKTFQLQRLMTQQREEQEITKEAWILKVCSLYSKPYLRFFVNMFGSMVKKVFEEKLIILFVNFKNFVVSFGPVEWAVEMFNCY